MLKTILVPLDGSVLAEQALGTAALLARAAHASVDLVTVLEPMPLGGFDDAPWNDKEWEARRKYVEAAAADLSTGAAIAATGTILRGQPTSKLCERERAIDADLVVMTAHGRSGFNRAWLGSVADAMIRHSDVPVLVLRPEPNAMHPSTIHRSFTRVLVPLDGSALSIDILDAVRDMAKLSNARITLLRVLPPLPLTSAFEPHFPLAYTPALVDEAATKHLADVFRSELTERAARLHEDTGLTVETAVIVNDHTARAIIDYAKAHDVDLIAMSTHGRGASRFLLGSVADKVLRSSGLSVLMHHPVLAPDAVPSIDASSVSAQLPALGTV